MSVALVVVGLGNPGPQYQSTRHNAGFWVAQKLADDLGLSFSKPIDCPFGLIRLPIDRLVSLDSRANPVPPPAGDLLLIKPYTYMNRSGDIFGPLRRRYRPADGWRLLVVADQMDLAPGDLRLKAACRGSSHNGLKSVMAALGSDFAPLYFGIGRPPPGQTVLDYVLGIPGRAEQVVYETAIRQAVQSIAIWALRGLDAAVAFTNAR